LIASNVPPGDITHPVVSTRPALSGRISQRGALSSSLASSGRMTHHTAVAWAAAEVERVRDDPQGRMTLLARTYERLCGSAPRFRRAALSFMQWQAERGVLRPPAADRPGSAWWRAVNERLLLDGCEAVARSAGFGGEASSRPIELWHAFIGSPSPRAWYRAHNATIVSAYLENREVAEAESKAERFFLNVALLRVLYVHALVEAPRLALGRFAAAGPFLGDPRLGTVGAYLSLGRVLPDRYPLLDELDTYLVDENSLGRVVDYGVIAPRIQALYEWSAGELGQPHLRELARDGSPVYAWAYADRRYWMLAPEPFPVRALRRATSPR
jgi:hypothetical protein